MLITVRGERLRGSTEETNAARASKIAGLYKGKHIGAAYINRQWVKARKAAKLPDDLGCIARGMTSAPMSCAKQGT